MKKAILIIISLSIMTMLIAHPKFMKVNPNSSPINYARADSLHGFDIIAYDIWLKIDDIAQSVNGAVNAQVTAEENLSNISYELEGLIVDSVYVNGSLANFTHNNGLINISLDVASGSSFTTRVVYHGNPILSNDGYNNGMTFRANQIFTVSDPNAGRYWWPSYDHPWDKAKVDLHVRVRSDWKVAANGIRQSIDNHSDNTSTHHWLGSNPMATYLVSIACAPYEEITGTFQDIPLHNFVLANQVAVGQTMFAKLPQMMQAFSDAYGPYPFEKYGNAVANINTFGAMEHQTMTTLGASIMGGTLANDYVVAHELSHQWFGNCLTPLTWKDVWLSESFATYSEAVYTEAVFGYEAFCSYVQSSYHNYYLNFANSNGDRVIYDPIYSEYFYPMVYEKGASILHMLRAWVGNEVFFDILQTYFQTYHNQNVVTSEFKAIAEEISGQNLDQFFDQWIFKKGIPTIDYIVLKKSDNSALKTVARTVSNEANNHFYMKAPMRIASSAGIDSVLVDITPEGAISNINLNSVISSYAFDPKNWMLTRGNTEHFVVLNDTFASESSVIINWSGLEEWTGINTYNVYRSTNANNDYEKVNNEPVEGLIYVDNSVSNGQEYFYKITACLGEFETEYSNAMSAFPLDFPLDQGLLVVDETSDGNGNILSPTDLEVDSFYDRIIDSDFTSWDVAAQGLPSIEVMRNYSMIIWHDDDTVTSLIDETTQKAFASYILSGGKLILSGWRTANSINNPYLLARINGHGNTLVNAISFNGAISQTLPELNTDIDKLNANWNGNMPSICVFPNATSIMYRAQFANNSAWQNSPVIVSGENIIVSGLPFYYMQEEAVHELISLILDDWSVDKDDIVKPLAKLIVDIYPNPARLNQDISFKISNQDNSPIRLSVYNIKGQLVKREIIQVEKNRDYLLQWDKRDKDQQALPSGIYFIKAQSDKEQIIKKQMIIK
ncbi:MAG TPA: M1 family aminopeptidase [Candidatus Cloacimonadota bacterium]|nr:M1 family aminopeptidase [Candidatus Cloacimonadota bacterium]HQB40692.1 M1 family aminopeptidase [Candidatus Cloacimonadota bacterium]